MNRPDLFALAKSVGKKDGKPLTPAQRKDLRTLIASKLTADELAQVRVFTASGGGRPMTLEEATDALLEEFD